MAKRQIPKRCCWWTVQFDMKIHHWKTHQILFYTQLYNTNSSLMEKGKNKLSHLLSWSVLTTRTEGGPIPFTVDANTEIVYLTNSFSPVRLTWRTLRPASTCPLLFSVSDWYVIMWPVIKPFRSSACTSPHDTEMLVELVLRPLTFCGFPSGSDKQV